MDYSLLAINGSADELSVTGADFYRLPAAAVARDEMTKETGAINCGEIGWTDEELLVPSGDGRRRYRQIHQQQTASAGRRLVIREKRKKGTQVQVRTGFSWMQNSFSVCEGSRLSSRHGDVTTCVVTIEADDDFVTAFDTKPKLFVVNKGDCRYQRGDLERLSERIKKRICLRFTLSWKESRPFVKSTRTFAEGLSHNQNGTRCQGCQS
jgi:hypothetical protein